MINSAVIPEKINEYNAYLDGRTMVGVASSVTLPEINMQTSTISGMGVSGEIDSPTLGQFESMEMVVPFNTLYGSAVDLLNPLNAVNLTLRGALQVYDKASGGGYVFVPVRIVANGRVKKFNPGKMEKNSSMEAEVTLELTYLMIEANQRSIIEVDKLNAKYTVNGVDMLASVRNMS